uniref:Uncharacterized protein n=1 Tax=Anopheles culicifacies TaxID=139723 RepID=A0A182LVK0_9DIPT
MRKYFPCTERVSDFSPTLIIGHDRNRAMIHLFTLVDGCKQRARNCLITAILPVSCDNAVLKSDKTNVLRRSSLQRDGVFLPEHPVVLSQWGQQLNSSKLGPKEEGDDIVLTCRVVGVLSRARPFEYDTVR